jgi:hypothetical protein
MLEKIGGKREEATDRGLEGFVGWHGDEVEAEQFVCMGEIVRCQKNSCFTSRPASKSEFTWRESVEVIQLRKLLLRNFGIKRGSYSLRTRSNPSQPYHIQSRTY